MGIAERSRARVEDLLADLERVYDSVPVNQRTVAISADRYEQARERYSEDSVDTYVQIENDDGDVLHVGEDEDALPGTVGSPGEGLPDEVSRAVAERTGVEFSIDGLDEVTIVGIRNADDPDAGTLYRLLVVFSASYEGGDPTPEAEWRATAGQPTPTYV